MSLKILPYDNIWHKQLEIFRDQALLEGNDSLIKSKLDTEQFDGQLLLCFWENTLVSISACEASHYTGDPHFAARICRYHVLAQFRSQFLFCGFNMLIHHCQWADDKGFQLVYFTQDIKNRPLNTLYQRKKKYTLGANNEWFNDPTFQSFKLCKDNLFQVSKKSPLLQFVYVRKQDTTLAWTPPKGIIKMPQEIQESLR